MMVEPVRLALTSTPSIIPSSAEETVPASAAGAPALADDQTASADVNTRAALPAASHDIAWRIAPSCRCRTHGRTRVSLMEDSRRRIHEELRARRASPDAPTLRSWPRAGPRVVARG